MGVTGLWKLIEPCGTPVPIETLEGKILAVDISIWLHQVVKGFQDSSGSALAHAHLLGLFHRLCKLMYYRVKPVFVFDGCVPQLKRETIAKRQQQRSKLNTEADRIQNLLLEQLAKEQVVQQALGNAASDLVPLKRITAKPSAKENDEMFKLPELPSGSKDNSFGNSQDESSSSVMETSLESSDEEENCAQRYYTNNLQAIDVKSKDFRNLPADMRYDILVDIKETRKQSSWGRLHELPAQSDDFSLFQMKRLLKRRAVQESLEDAEKEMGGRTLTYAELQTYFKEEGVLEESAFEEASRQIACDENTRYLLVQDLKKQLTKESGTKVLETIKEEDKVVEVSQKEQLKETEESEDYEADLQLAIALSLSEQEADTLYKEEDYVLKDNKLKLNKIQREKLKYAAKGPAKMYMIEHAGMNQDEVVDILESSQICQPTKGKVTEEVQLSSESEIEVEVSQERKSLEVVINLDKPAEVDDLFADVFSLEAKKQDSVMDSDSDADLIEVATELDNSQKPIEKVLSVENILQKELDLIEVAKDLENVKKCNENQQKLENQSSEKSSLKKSETSPNVEQEIIVKKSTENQQKSEDLELFENSKQSSEKSSLKKTETETEKSANVEQKLEDLNLLESLPKSSKKSKGEKFELETVVNTMSIFEEMRKQMENVKKIDLSKVEIKNDIVDVDAIEDNDGKVQVKQEVVEIKTPRGTPSKKSNSKPVTPSRITDFYNTDYVIKRTPESIKKEDTEEVAKVKSPFFRNKTPKSKATKSHKPTADVEMKTPTKAVRELFPTTEDVIMNVAADLKQQKTQQELHEMATDLAKERRNLESERNRQDRMGMSISQRMNSECQELLRLFGVPYIVAPMEAEAQCAFLDAVQLTNGTITDDSDIWLFGGRTVYKNFFVQNKHVMKFSADEIETQFKCDRHTLVQLACLVGSDYTTGVNGIGAVTALEILSSFTREASKKAENTRHRIALIMDTLQRFRDWWQTSKMSAAPPGSSARQTLLKKLKNIELNEGFPSVAVIEAYLLPKVDESRTAFSWGQPDVESIREFARKTFGWTTTKTNEILAPVLKRLAEKRTQTTMRNYFLTSNAVKSRELKVSKRVQGAIQRLALGGENGNEEVADLEAAPAKKKKKQNLKRLKSQTSKEDANEETEEVQPSTSKKSSQKKKAQVNLGRKKDIIPQREKELEEMRKKKELAAALFKSSKATNQKKKII